MTFLRCTILGILGVGLSVLAGGAQAVQGPLTAPKGLAPANGIPEFAPSQLTLSWSPVSGATWYDVHVHNNAGGTNLLLPCPPVPTAGGCWTQNPSLSIALTTDSAAGSVHAPGNYTWYVSAYRAGSLSAYSTATFIVVSRFGDTGLTVVDYKTRLEWEKKTTDGSIHDVNNGYTWSTGTTSPDGTAFTQFLAGINAGPCVEVLDQNYQVIPPLVDCSFADHGDWRLPTYKELSTIYDCTLGPSCTPTLFGPPPTGESIFVWTSSHAGGNTDAVITFCVSSSQCSIGSAYSTPTTSQTARAVRKF